MSAGLPGFTRRELTIYIEDGAAKSETVGPGEATWTFSGIAEGDRGVIEVKNRGFHTGLLQGDQEPIEFSLTAGVGTADGLTDASAHRILDAIRKTGSWASATSKESIGCGVWAFQMRFVLSNSCGKSATITFAKVRATADLSMTDNGMELVINCTAYGDGSGGASYTIT